MFNCFYFRWMYVDTFIINYTILFSFVVQIKNFKNFIVSHILNEFFRYIILHENAENFYLTTNWTNNANLIIFSKNVNNVSTYEKNFKFFDAKKNNRNCLLYLIILKKTKNIFVVSYNDFDFFENFDKSIFKIKTEKIFVKKKINFDQKKI